MADVVGIRVRHQNRRPISRWTSGDEIKTDKGLAVGDRGDSCRGLPATDCANGQTAKAAGSAGGSGETFLPGDIITWDLGLGGTEHIGMVVNVWYKPEQRYLIVHNIGAGTRMEDVLFAWKITGHYRYF